MVKKANDRTNYLAGIKASVITAVVMAVVLFVSLVIQLIASSSFTETFSAINSYLVFYAMASVGQFVKNLVFGIVYAFLFVWFMNKAIFEKISSKSLYLHGIVIYLIMTAAVILGLGILSLAITGEFLSGDISVSSVIDVIISILVYSAVFVYVFRKLVKGI